MSLFLISSSSAGAPKHHHIPALLFLNPIIGSATVDWFCKRLRVRALTTTVKVLDGSGYTHVETREYFTFSMLRSVIFLQIPTVVPCECVTVMNIERLMDTHVVHLFFFSLKQDISVENQIKHTHD